VLAAVLACERVDKRIASVEAKQFGARLTWASDDRMLASFQGPARAVYCAQALGATARNFGMHFRAGVHVGECEPGGGALSGFTVNLAERIADRADSGELLVSGTVRDLMAGSGVGFRDRGTLTIDGRQGRWLLFSAERAQLGPPTNKPD
jgi:class 3 adenylate cyclase